jgi:predicted ribosome quality control (RQC) complex YloA/Tae2 family protein
MFDVLTIAAMAEELGEILIDRPVRNVGLIDRRTLALGIFVRGRERFLIASVDPENSYLLWTDREPAVDAQLVTPFLLLLRKYVRGGVIASVQQPPLERVIQVSIAKRLSGHNEPEIAAPAPADEAENEDEAEHEGETDATFVHLSIEIMGRRGNIILVDDDDFIMESIKRVTPAMSRVRPIAPRLRFTSPPPQRGSDPRSFSAAIAREVFATANPDEPAARILTRALAATSPQLAEEIVFRAAGSASIRVGDLAPDLDPVIARETRHLFEPLLTSAWSPMLYSSDEGEIVAFAAIPLEHLGGQFSATKVDSILKAVDEATRQFETEGSPTKHARRRARLVDAIARVADRTKSRLDSLQEQQRRSLEADELRQKGELIYAYLWMIKPGQAELSVDDQTIALDPALSPSDNAQAYFERYRKLQAADDQLPALIDGAEHQLRYLDELRTLASQATKFEDVEAIAVEWDRYEREHGIKGAANGKSYRRSAPPKRTRPLYDRTGALVYLGRSGAENDRITFEIAGADDTWLHARGVPGSHVIVRRQGGSEAEFEAALNRAASLAAYYSGARNSGTVEVDIAKRRDVRKIKGAGLGMVTYRNERTIPVRPANEEELGLAARLEQ